MKIEIEISDKNVTDVVKGLGIAGQYPTEKEAIEGHLALICLNAAKASVETRKRIELDNIVKNEVSEIDIKPAVK